MKSNKKLFVILVLMIFTFLCGGAGCGALYASGFDVNSLFARYRALDLFGRAADALPFYAAALLVSCALLCAAFCMAGNRRTAWGEWLRRAERMLFGNITALLEKAAKNKRPRRLINGTVFPSFNYLLSVRVICLT